MDYNGQTVAIKQDNDKLERFGYAIGDKITVSSLKMTGTVTGAVVITPNFDSFGLGAKGIGAIYIEVELEDGTEMRTDSRDITHYHYVEYDENAKTLAEIMGW